MRISTVIPGGDWRATADAAKVAEATGFGQIQANELKHDPFATLIPATLTTDRIGLATSVAIAFPRSPMIVAGLAWDLQRNSRGRFVLGLGSQVKGHNERRFSVPWSPPAPRMAEYVEALRAIWRSWKSGEKLDYRGQTYTFTLMTPEFAQEPSDLPMVPITIAAVGPAMQRLAGRLCDGVRLHSFCTRGYIEKVVMPEIEAGFAASGRDRSTFEISGGGFVATGPDKAAVREAAEHVRYRVAFYGSTPAYRPVLGLHGYEDLGVKLSGMAKNGEWSSMAAAVPDEVLNLFAAVGTYDELPERIAERFGGVVDSVSIEATPGTDPAVLKAVIETARRIPSPFEGFATSWK
ncbi:MAG: TIGR03617 family F420-dependent LLM class oxidoreductase [Hyphomicrobiaceae bacterium]|nr:TIGR03617 family F420-dependent LLM class oxidoreductase [Hyphomicrobiaceae bacterium]